MKSANANIHLTLEERRIIRKGIESGSTKTAIARTIGKDNSTVGKEIKLHRQHTQISHIPLDCIHYKKCKFPRNCLPSCPDYVKFTCKRRDRSPGACNGCQKNQGCKYDKYYYYPEIAENEYRTTLVDSRVGFNITESEAKALCEIILPLLKQGLSPYAILQIHPEIKLSEKTLYNYIENGLFKDYADISSFDLRRQVNRRQMPKKNLYKKREDRKFLIGRTYKDYKAYLEEDPDAFVTQMDTVYNDISNGPYIQTFKFVEAGFLFALYHEEKTSASMTDGVDLLEKILGPECFRKYVNILLTDRGSEFVNAEGMEKDKNDFLRTRVFYCDPMQSGQKGSLENNHSELRYILVKHVDLKAIGLVDQSALNLVLSHVNSLPIEKFGGKSPFDILEFLFPDLYEKLLGFGLQKIPSNEIVLKPYLLKDTRPKKAKKILSNPEKESVAKEVIAPVPPKKPPHSCTKNLKPSALTEAEMLQLKYEGLSPQQIAQRMELSVATYYRRLAALKKR